MRKRQCDIGRAGWSKVDQSDSAMGCPYWLDSEVPANPCGRKTDRRRETGGERVETGEGGEEDRVEEGDEQAEDGERGVVDATSAIIFRAMTLLTIVDTCCASSSDASRNSALSLLSE